MRSSDPADFPRYRQLNVIPSWSFQWGKAAPDTLEARASIWGPARFKSIEPAGLSLAAAVRTHPPSERCARGSG